MGIYTREEGKRASLSPSRTGAAGQFCRRGAVDIRFCWRGDGENL
jgi:hypothetical protein